MHSQKDSLRLSVISISYGAASNYRQAIEDLRRQTAREELEVIVVSADGAGLEEKDFDGIGAWQQVILPEVRTMGKAMEAAVRVAKAPFVTYAEEHGYLPEDWAEGVIAAHEKGYDVVGFAMENANPKTLTSWAQFYGQFGHVAAPVKSGESNYLGGHHVSYRKETLLDYGSLLSDVLEDEAALLLDLRAKGIKMFIVGDAVGHLHFSGPKIYAYMDYLGQRGFASTRAKIGHWPWWKRGAYAAAASLIPWIRLRRSLADICRTGRQDLVPRILVPLVPALLAGAWGEMLGYLIGAGDSAERKAPGEFERRRFLAEEDTLVHAPDKSFDGAG